MNDLGKSSKSQESFKNMIPMKLHKILKESWELEQSGRVLKDLKNPENISHDPKES